MAKPDPSELHGWPIQRLYDLVRYCRHYLHDEGLLTNAEYGAIVATGADSARRLEAYDAIQRRAERRGAALQHIARLDVPAEVDPHGILRAAVDVARNAVSEHPAEEADEWPQWLVRWMGGEPLGCSTGIHGGTTYGYGKLDANGFWQVPVPAAFADALHKNALAYAERNRLVPGGDKP
jgi:hypothetical protein